MTFKLSDANWLACLADLAYQDDPKVEGALSVRRIFSAATEIHFLLIEYAEKVVLVGRGTKGRKNLFEDAAIQFVKVGGGIKIHKGFYDALMSVWDQIEPILVACKKTLYLAGHSLGAALVRVCLWKMRTAIGMLPAAIYTIGEPRSFNRAGAKWLEGLGVESWRIVNRSDVVTWIPWRCGLYRHVGNSAWLELDGIEFNVPAIWRIPEAIGGLIREWKLRKGGDVLIFDHGADRYCKDIAALPIAA